jgi:hypothetical protein
MRISLGRCRSTRGCGPGNPGSERGKVRTDWLVPVLFFPSALVVLHVVGPWLFVYELAENEFLIRLSRRGPVLRRVAYESILEVRVASFIDIVFATKWLNRLVGSAVLLQLDRGWWRMLVISPADPERFIEVLRRRMRPVLTL